MDFAINNLKQAEFIRECKNRFICEVKFEGRVIECYVPSSCKLSNFFELDGKPVLIIPTSKHGTRTSFALFAVKYRNNYILLNSSFANRIIIENITSRRFSFLGSRKKVYQEYFVSDYKSDIYIDDTNTIIEVKSIMSTGTSAIFPSVYSGRAIEQLNALKTLILQGYNAHLVIVSLNPYIKNIFICKNSMLYGHLIECIALGMTVIGFSCRLIKNYVLLDKSIKIDYK